MIAERHIRSAAAAVALLALAMVRLPGAHAAGSHLTQESPTASATGPTYIYDSAFAGAKTAVRAINVPLSGLSLLILEVSDMPQSVRGRSLGAHVHTKPCAADAAVAGPHHANPAASAALPLASKEVWLDLNIDNRGQGMAIALFDWRIRKGDAGSVVVHADPTNAVSGAAGARVLCTTIPLGD